MISDMEISGKSYHIYLDFSRFLPQLMYKLTGTIVRAFDYIRYLPIRIFRVFRHLGRGGKGLYKGLTGACPLNTLPAEFSLWMVELGICLLECFGIAEIYETLMDFVKFNTRPLQAWELELAQSVFGKSINYQRVRIDEYAVAGPRQKKLCYVSFFIINSWGPMRNSLLIHELIHVWQYEQMGAVYIPRALRAQFSNAGYNYGGAERLQHALEQGLSFQDFNLEQQGDIVADYYRIREGYSPRWGNGNQQDLPVYEEFIRQLRSASSWKI